MVGASGVHARKRRRTLRLCVVNGVSLFAARQSGPLRGRIARGTGVAECLEVSLDKRTARRIAVACAEDALRARATAQLSAAGASPVPLSSLAQLEAARCDLTLIFAEGFPAAQLLECLARCGPVVIVVSDDSPLRSRPSATVITRSAWAASGVQFVLGVVEGSGPELPFTD